MRTAVTPPGNAGSTSVSPTPPSNPAGDDTGGLLQSLGPGAEEAFKSWMATQGGSGGSQKQVRLVPAYRTAGEQAPGDQPYSPPGVSEHVVEHGFTPNTNAPEMRDSDDVKNDFNRMTDAQLDDLGDRLVQAHLLPTDWALQGGRAALQTQWNNLVERATAYSEANPDARLTPEDMIALYSGRSAPGKNAGTQTSTDITYSQRITAPQARSMLEQMMTGMLGRAPTAREADNFQAALNDAQANNPTVQTTTYTTDEQGNRTSTSRTTGGNAAQDYTDQYQQDLKQTNEYKHYQAATTYYNALIDALRSPTNLVNIQ